MTAFRAQDARDRCDLRRARPGRPARALGRRRGHARLDAARPRRPPRRLGRGGRPGDRASPVDAALAGRPGGGHRRLERAARRGLARRSPAATLARYDAARRGAARRGRDAVARGAPLARRLELGLRLPARPRPQAPRHGRSVVRVGSPERPADGRRRRRRPRGAGLTIEAIVAVDAPREFRAPSARPDRRLHGRGRRRATAVHAVAARRRAADPAHGVGEGRHRPAVVARRTPARLRP